VAANASAGDSAATPPAIEKLHNDLSVKLRPEQSEALDKVYPNFKVVAVCTGTFSGSSDKEAVVGVWKPVHVKEPWKTELHRVGLIWNGSGWETHLIDDEIEKDKDKSRSFPMMWQHSLTSEKLDSPMKCGIENEFVDGSDLSEELGDKPFFDRKKAGIEGNKVVCFSTDDVYNNWDCLVFDPKEKRFRLWYQQAHAD
jgi:hypothetical protein